jgi:oligopeptidase A
MTNPLLQRHELPPFSDITAELVVPAITTILAENRQHIETLVSSGAADWQSLVAPMESLSDRLAQAFSPVAHMNAVVSSDALRDAYNACLPLVSEYSTEVSQNKALYLAYEKISRDPGFGTLAPAQQQVVKHALRDFELAGVGLANDMRERFAQIDKRLSELSSTFSDNVLDASMGWTRAIDDVAELAGLPDMALALLAQAAAEQNPDDESSVPAEYLITLDFPVYHAVMTYCDNRSLRQEVYTAFVTRASDQGPQAGAWDNSAVIDEIMSLRCEVAEVLGFGNFAEVSLATKMAETPDQVLDFLKDLRDRSRPAAEREFDELQAFAEMALAPWDVNYYSEKLKKAQYDVSDEETRPYFPISQVLSGLFLIVHRLYDIEIEQTSDIDTWHSDVTTYNITRQGKLIARFYLDPYARKNKRGGAWMDDCRVRRIDDDGHLQLPVAYLNCNFTPPLGEQPALLTHDEVVTLFHEFGHGLHHMMTQVDCAAVSGINGVAWDAVELPSQFMENWCWEKESLAMISGHHESGESLPDELLHKMLAAKNFQSAMMMVRQLEFAMFDLRLHVEYDRTSPDQVQAILNEVRAETAVVDAPDFNRFQHGFSHIFGGGYAAGYYSYKWAEVLSADAFARFREDGIFNRQTGERFLETILEQGGSRDAMDLFVEFRGRPPQVEALLIQEGIVGEP